MAIQLDPVIQKHAEDLARIIRAVHHRSRSEAEIQAKFEAYFRRVADELNALGEPPDKVAEMALVAIGVLLDEMSKRLKEEENQQNPSE